MNKIVVLEVLHVFIYAQIGIKIVTFVIYMYCTVHSRAVFTTCKVNHRINSDT